MQTSSPRALASYSEWLDPRFRVLLLFQMAVGYTYSALTLVPKFATVGLHADPKHLGLLAACPVLAAVVCAPACGLLLDRGGYRVAMTAGAFLFSLAVIGFGSLAALGPLAYVLRSLHGVANTLLVGGVGAYVTRLVPAERHGRAFGTAGAASLVMNAVASSATERLVDLFGWSVAYQVAGGTSAFALGLALRTPAIEPRFPRAPAGASYLDRRRRLAAGYATFAAGAAFGMLGTFTQPYALSLGVSHVASLFVGYTLTALGIRLGLGNAVDRWGRQRAALVALTAYTCTVLVASALRPGTLFALGLGFGLAHGLAWPALTALAVETAPSNRTGSALTRVQALFAAGAMLSLWLGGRLVDAYGYAFAFLAIGLGVATGALALVRGTLR